MSRLSGGESQVQVWLFVLILLLLSGCESTVPPPPQATSPTAEPSAEQPEEEPTRLRSRFLELKSAGTPEKVLKEFSARELVIGAPAVFEHHARHGSLHLYSDRPFQEKNALKILEEVERRLRRSPLYEGKTHAAFICNDPWKEDFFLRSSQKIGGDNHYPTAPHAFLTRGLVDEDALYSPRGRPIAPPRTLTYYLAHEFTHTVMGRSLTDKNWKKLPHWLFEGYPDYIGLGPSYTYETALEMYQGRDPRVNGTLAEDYMRYGVMVAYALEKRKIPVEKLMNSPPDETELLREAGLR